VAALLTSKSRHPFTPLYDDVMAIRDLTLTAKVVLCRILRYGEGGIHPSKETLASALSVSLRTVFNALRELQDAEYIAIERVGKKINNRYAIDRQKLPITLSAKIADHGGKDCRSLPANVADPYRETTLDTDTERGESAPADAGFSPPSENNRSTGYEDLEAVE